MDKPSADKSEDQTKLTLARELMARCGLCPRCCQVHRFEGQVGFCGIADKLIVSSYGPHFGEEHVLVGRGGSGTIFLAGCNLGCLFCQNYTISHYRQGREIDVSQMVRIMLDLETSGCKNINFVTPTHVAPLILEAIIDARAAGLTVPIVYNCSGYESVQMLDLLEGYVEIYMPDVKFFDADLARQLTGRDDYPKVAAQAVKIMHQQVGDLVCDDQGLATRGLLVRHLVMPNHVNDSLEVMDFLASQISPNTYVNVMGQYHPQFKADQFEQINRPLRAAELQQVRQYAQRLHLRLAR